MSDLSLVLSTLEQEQAQQVSQLFDLLVRSGLIAANVSRNQVHAKKKADNSDVTDVDLLISAQFKQLEKTTSIPVVTEEDIEQIGAARFSYREYWLVDPLDGTKGFIRNEDNFCHMAALIKDQVPVLSLILAPRGCFAPAGELVALDNHGLDPAATRGLGQVAVADLTAPRQQAMTYLLTVAGKVYWGAVSAQLKQASELPEDLAELAKCYYEQELAVKTSCFVLKPQLYQGAQPVLCCGTAHHKLFARLSLPLKPATPLTKTSAGIKTIHILTSPCHAYLLGGFMGEWDLAPAAAALAALGGGCFDLATGKWLEFNFFNQRTVPLIAPLLMVANKQDLDKFLDLPTYTSQLEAGLYQQALAQAIARGGHALDADNFYGAKVAS